MQPPITDSNFNQAYFAIGITSQQDLSNLPFHSAGSEMELFEKDLSFITPSGIKDSPQHQITNKSKT